MRPFIVPLQGEMTLFHLPETRFRTQRLTGVFSVPLTEETAAEYAILPGILTRCCEQYPTMASFVRQLDSLYGAVVSGNVIRMGRWQTLVFSVSYLEEKYTLNHTDLTAQCTQLLLDLLFAPALEGEGFREEIFSLEQRCLKEHLEGEINNKRRYARNQCARLLCPHTPYAVNPLGTVEAVASLTPAGTYKALDRLLKSARIHWIYQGNGDRQALINEIEARFASIERRPAVDNTPIAIAPAEKEQKETMAVKQAKLVLGFRLPVTEDHELTMAARLMNCLLGGCPSSLLFRHVREEQSLCYYCASNYSRLEGTLYVDSGVEIANAEKAKNEILRQVDAIRNGNFSDEELEAARRAMAQGFASFEETPGDVEAFYISQTFRQTVTTPADTVKELAGVTREQVCRAAQLTEYEVTYLLCPDEEVQE